MQFDVGDSVMAKWPGSKLFYIAKIQLVRAEDNEYDVEYENGSVFTIPAKDTYKQNSVSFRKAIHSNRSKSKSRARSKGRAQRTKKKVDLGDESSADESLPVEEAEKKKASNSSRVSRKSTVASPVASPRASNSSKVSGRDPKASNSSRMSNRSKRVSNTSLLSNKATTDAFSEDDDDIGMLSVSARASRSSQIAPENESELELLATDQTQLTEEAELAPNVTAARASISSRISSLIFGASATPTPAEADTPDRVSLDSVSEDEDAEVSQNASGRPSASSKKASVSSRISAMLFGGSSSPKSPSTSSKIEEAAEDTNAETSSKRASASSGTSTQEYDTLVLRNRTVAETLSPLSELGQDDDENDAAAAESSTAAALTEDEEDNGAQPVSARASASSRKVSASSKKASVSSRVSTASKKASTSSRLSQKEELIESAEEEAPADVTEEMESSEKTSNVDKASISSRISNILFGGTPKASTSSKVSETNGTQPAEKIIEDIAAAEVSSFPFISARRSSRASTRASTIASKASVRKSASPNRSGGLDEFSEDEEKAEPAAAGEPQSANEEKAEATTGSSSWSVEWVWAIFFMLLCPAILVSLHTICTGHVCNLAVPRLSIDPRLGHRCNLVDHVQPHLNTSLQQGLC